MFISRDLLNVLCCSYTMKCYRAFRKNEDTLYVQCIPRNLQEKISKIQSSMKTMPECFLFFFFLSRRQKCVFVSNCTFTVAEEQTWKTGCIWLERLYTFYTLIFFVYLLRKHYLLSQILNFKVVLLGRKYEDLIQISGYTLL